VVGGGGGRQGCQKMEKVAVCWCEQIGKPAVAGHRKCTTTATPPSKRASSQLMPGEQTDVVASGQVSSHPVAAGERRQAHHVPQSGFATR